MTDTPSGKLSPAGPGRRARADSGEPPRVTRDEPGNGTAEPGKAGTGRQDAHVRAERVSADLKAGL